MRAFYGSRFSPNQTATPEGFLICHNVPIARTGWQDYLGEEIGADDQAGKLVHVFRSPEEVFNPASIASFEGKILTDEHPPGAIFVTPENATRYAKGVVQNVRQGSGTDSDLLIADLVVYDQTLIDEIQEGKREVSAGYDLKYVKMDDGTYQQQQIWGNHVAVVKSGRAGDRVAIKDSKTTEIPEGEKKMAKFVVPRKGIFSALAAFGFKQFALDAEPEDIKAAMDAMAEEQGQAPAPITQKDPAKDPAKDDDPIQALSAQVAQLTALVTKLAQGGAAQEPENAIDDAIAALEKPAAPANDDDEEESHTIPAEQMDEAGPVSNPEDRPKSAITGDNAYKIAALRAMKPIIAAISDPAERKRASDAAIASINGKPVNNTYANINKNQRKPATDNKTADADHSQLGRDIANKHNPHYKNRV